MRSSHAAAICLFLALTTAHAQPTVRVALLDFQDQTESRPNAIPDGLSATALANKGTVIVAKHLLHQAGLVLIDRRDFFRQIEQIPSGLVRGQLSFLHAAQRLNADLVLRSSLTSFATGTRRVRQGGHSADFVTLSVRVTLEALDPVNGTVVGIRDGAAHQEFRQTDSVITSFSEDDVLQLLEQAVADATGPLQEQIKRFVQQREERAVIQLSIHTTADPALVEIDGILVGSTPLENYTAYKGDHILTIGKPGYQDITKQILLEQDTRIHVPMLRTELTVEELKDVLDKMRLNVYAGIEPALIIETLDRQPDP